MNKEEKNTLARFLDCASDYLGDGHAKNRKEYSFQDDEPAELSAGDFSSLPLAYQVDEEEHEASDSNEDSISPGSREGFAEISAVIRDCTACGLAAARINTVPGEGSSHPLVMVIGEGPGAEEDKTGRPFVGKAGQLLDKMLGSIGLFRDKNCYIANMVKCRPPDNRDPAPEEITACFPFMEQQILLLRPKVILCAGRIAAQNLLRTSQGINALRGRFMDLKIGDDLTVPVLSTFHPSAILREPHNYRRPAWEDLKLLRSKLGEFIDASPIPSP